MHAEPVRFGHAAGADDVVDVVALDEHVVRGLGDDALARDVVVDELDVLRVEPDLDAGHVATAGIAAHEVQALEAQIARIRSADARDRDRLGAAGPIAVGLKRHIARESGSLAIGAMQRFVRITASADVDDGARRGSLEGVGHGAPRGRDADLGDGPRVRALTADGVLIDDERRARSPGSAGGGGSREIGREQGGQQGEDDADRIPNRVRGVHKHRDRQPPSPT